MLARLAAALCCFFACCAAMSQTATSEAPAPPPPITFEEMRPVVSTAHGTEYVASFPSPVVSSHESNNVVPIRILVPNDKPGPFPTVIILHYWGALNRNVERTMARELNERGIAAVLMTLPYHLERTPPGSRSGELAIQANVDELNTTLLQSLQDTRRAIDFIQSRPEFDRDKIGVGGLSLGAIVTALVYGIDIRIKHAAFVLGGVDIAHILWHSSRVVPQREKLRSLGYTEQRLRDELLLEPATFLAARPDASALVVAARYDTVIPGRATEALIAALKQPRISWMNTGHFGGVFVQNRLLRQTCDYFESSFKGEEFVPMANLGAPTVRLGVQYSFDTGMDIGFGADIFSAGDRNEYAATVLATPRGLRLFFGKRAGRQVSVGALMDRKRLTIGVLWSTVL